MKNLDDVKEKLMQEAFNHPPTIGLVGLSGVGKSSTINALFKADLPVSSTTACTKAFETLDIELNTNTGVLKGNIIPLRIIDAPGLGESLLKDPEYLEMYKKYLPQCDVIIWVLAARNRALSVDQLYLKQLKEFSQRMLFVINQVDIVEPMNYDTRLKQPSREQEKNIKEIIKDRKEKIAEIIGVEPEIIAYSASENYNLIKVFKKSLDLCSKDRQWLIASLRAFDGPSFSQLFDIFGSMFKIKNIRKES